MAANLWKLGQEARKNLRSEVSTPQSVSRGYLSGFLGISQSRVNQLVNEGMPKTGKNKYPLLECAKWYIDYLKTLESSSDTVKSAKTRLLNAKAEMEELNLSRAKGESISKDEISQQFMAVLVTIKQEIEGMSGRTVTDLFEKSKAEMKYLLDMEIASTLNRISGKLKQLRPDRDSSSDS